MNVLFYLFLIKNVVGQQDWTSKPGIDYTYLYREAFDRPVGLQSESNSFVDMNPKINNGTSSFNKINVTELNDDSEIERPCLVYDKNCIRRYFAAHSMCTPKYQSVSEPLFRAQSTFYVQRVNMTVTSVDTYYTGATGRITEFYINKKTNRLLIAITYTNFTTTCDNVYFRFNRRAKEPVVTSAAVRALYGIITGTVIIPNLSNLRLDKSEVYFASNTRPDILITSPTVLGSGDPQMAISIVNTLLRVDLTLQESFLHEANYYAYTTIQQSICDFGLLLA